MGSGLITPLSARGRIKTEEADVAVLWTGTGEMQLHVAPGVPPERVMLAAAMLLRVANKMFDAAEYKHFEEQQQLTAVGAGLKNGGRQT